MNSKSSLSLIMVTLLVFGAARTLWALYGNYNRPEPLMDYVPQEIGIYDTGYQELDELDCRGCHGNSVADRHHMLDSVVRLTTCDPCHEVIDEPPFVIVVRDCLTGGCHSWDDVPANGWHHDTDEECGRCHGDVVVDEIDPFRDFNMDPPTALNPDLVPNPFSCGNCHWQQDVSATEDADDPGHPSTYEHYDWQGRFVGFHEYSKPILGSSDTHHMGFKGPVAANCSRCHGKDPNRVSWDPYDKELIRYCETCHSPVTLHYNIGSHGEDTSGWEAVGFHISENDNPTDAAPMVYRSFRGTASYLPEKPGGYTSDEICLGCHQVTMMPQRPEAPPSRPTIHITTSGITPRHGACGGLVTLRGEFFGDEHAAGYRVQMKLQGKRGWYDMPVYLWTDRLIRFKIPCWTLSPGGYKVRVITPTGKSNKVDFTLEARCCLAEISPAAGSCERWIPLSGTGFGKNRSDMSSDGYNGVHRVIDVNSLVATYSVLNYAHWSDNSIKVKLDSLFVDSAGVRTGPRNFVQDDGSGACREEPTVNGCDTLAPGVHGVSLKAIYFGDEDASGGLTCGDTIFQIVASDPVYFELVDLPSNVLCSKTIELRMSGGDGACFISTALDLGLRPMFRP